MASLEFALVVVAATCKARAIPPKSIHNKQLPRGAQPALGAGASGGRAGESPENR
jgi:hypothetical protein